MFVSYINKTSLGLVSTKTTGTWTRGTQYIYNAIVTTYCYFTQQNVICMVCLFLGGFCLVFWVLVLGFFFCVFFFFFFVQRQTNRKKIHTAGLCSVTVQFSVAVGRWSRDRQSLIPLIPLPTRGLCKAGCEVSYVVLYGNIRPLRNTVTASALCLAAGKWRGDAAPLFCPLLANKKIVLNFKGVFTSSMAPSELPPTPWDLSNSGVCVLQRW